MPALPRGSILLWSGAIAAIPAGFILCNGAGGSPDLRDRFIVGAGSAYAVGANGGAINHTHGFTGDGHTHIVGPGPNIASGANFGSTTNPSPATGTTDNGDGRPPFYSLAWIMKT